MHTEAFRLFKLNQFHLLMFSQKKLIQISVQNKHIQVDFGLEESDYIRPISLTDVFPKEANTNFCPE